MKKQPITTVLSFLIPLLILGILFSNVNTFAQVDNYQITGAKKGEIDTVGFQTAQKAVKEIQGLLETEIEPDKYIMGPNDILSVSVLSSKPIIFDATVAPDGKVLLRGVGIVDLTGKSFAEAVELITNKVKSVYRTDEVMVVLKELRQFKVIIGGSVRKPMTVTATAVDRVSEVIERSGGLKFDASVRKIKLIRNKTGITQYVDLMKFYLLGDKEANPFVQGGDHVVVAPSSEKEIIQIFGQVPSPGEFEFVEGDSLSTIIRFAQGFTESSFLDSVEISRFVDEGTNLERRYLNLNHWKNLLGKKTVLPGDFPLKTGDRVYIRTIPEWNLIKYAILLGEVRYPGKYAITEEERLLDVIERAGGFNKDAAIESIEFIRQQEQDKIDPEMERLKVIPASEMSLSEFRYFQAKKTEKKGAMAIDFKKLLEDHNSDDNILMRHKDSVIVPQRKDYVNIQGRVNNPGNVSYKPGYTYEDYIRLAGGYGYRADEGETFIAKSKGELFLAENKNYVIEPGDVILVPPDKEISWMEVATTSLTVLTQVITIFGVVFTVINF